MVYTLYQGKTKLGEFVNIKKARAGAFPYAVKDTKAVITIKDADGKVAGSVDSTEGLIKFRKDGQTDFGVNRDGGLYALKGDSKAKERAKKSNVAVPSVTGRPPRRPAFEKMKYGNIPMPDRYSDKGNWVVARRDDRSGTIMFVDKKGELTVNINNALRYSDNRTVKGKVIKGDKAKATDVARRMNRERKDKHEKWFVARIAKLKDEDGKVIKGENNKPKMGIKGSDISFDKADFSNRRNAYILTVDGSVVGRERTLLDARKSAIEWGYKVKPVYISKTIPVSKMMGDEVKHLAGRSELIGTVVWDGRAETYVWWTSRTGEKSAYDVKGRRVAGNRYAILSKYALVSEGKDIGKVAGKITVGDTPEDRRAKKYLDMQKEFAQSGINFRVEDRKR